MIEFLKSIPTIISMIMQLKKLWDEYLAEEYRRQKMKELSDAIAKSRQTGDTSHIEDVLRSVVNTKPQ